LESILNKFEGKDTNFKFTPQIFTLTQLIPKISN